MAFGETLIPIGQGSVARYTHPQLDEPAFSSPMLRTANLMNAHLPITWKKLMVDVHAGAKPMATLDGGPEDGAAMLEAWLEVNGGTYPFRFEPYVLRGYTEPRYCLMTVARSGWIGAQLDLEALVADYRLLLAPDPSAADRVAKEMEALSTRNFADYLDFSDLDADHRLHPAGEFARSGLLLGYPPETTAALIGQQLGWPGYMRSELHNVLT